MKNIVVLGGGTAGWLTALYAKTRYPKENVTVIESKLIGILGAGESSVPDLLPFLNKLQISIKDIIKETNATIKIGIKFTGWDNNRSYYFHNFAKNKKQEINNDISLRALNKNFSEIDIDELISIFECNRNNSKIDVMAITKNYLPFIKINESDDKTFKDFDRLTNFSINFDAAKLADFLSKKSLQRGIKTIDAKVESFEKNIDGDIKKLVLDTGELVDCDFLFDCSGFARLTIGKEFKSKWISFAKHLPTNRAIPFFLDIDDNSLEPYTESIAMDYGWMWKTPLQNRYGCGYVFDSKLISDDDAKKEIEKFLGHSIVSPKTFSFEPGHFDRIWINNAVAIGLASGFVEPLEATSIMQTFQVLNLVLSPTINIFDALDYSKQNVNKKYKDGCNDILNIIYLHYMTDKTNTSFWKDYVKNNEMPEELETIIHDINNYRYKENQNKFFKTRSYYTIMDGNGILDREKLQALYDQYLKIYSEKIKNKNLEKLNKSNNFISHVDFLNYIKGE